MARLTWPDDHDLRHPGSDQRAAAVPPTGWCRHDRHGKGAVAGVGRRPPKYCPRHDQSGPYVAHNPQLWPVFLSRDGRIRTGDPLNPIRRLDWPNPGKKPCKSLVERTICRSCLRMMPESAGINGPNNGPNGHRNGHKQRPPAGSALRASVRDRLLSYVARSGGLRLFLRRRRMFAGAGHPSRTRAATDRLLGKSCHHDG